MLFQPHLCRMILNGRKTETRRLVKPGRVGAAPRCFYRAGHSYRLERPMRLDEANEHQAAIIEGRRRGRPPKKEVGRIQITSVRQEPLGDITFASARAEGFRTQDDFKAYWVRLHDRRWIARAEHHPASGIGPTLELTASDLVERFDQHWAQEKVWAIAFSVEAAQLFLAERVAGADYVTSPQDEHGRRVAMVTHIEVKSHDEPRRAGIPGWSHGELLAVPEEAVHPEIVDGWAKDKTSTFSLIKQRIRGEGHTTEADHREQRDRIARLELRIRQAKDTARRLGNDIRPDIAAYRTAQHAQSSLDHLERLVQALERHAGQLVNSTEASHAA